MYDRSHGLQRREDYQSSGPLDLCWGHDGGSRHALLRYCVSFRDNIRQTHAAETVRIKAINEPNTPVKELRAELERMCELRKADRNCLLLDVFQEGNCMLLRYFLSGWAHVCAGLPPSAPTSLPLLSFTLASLQSDLSHRTLSLLTYQNLFDISITHVLLLRAISHSATHFHLVSFHRLLQRATARALAPNSRLPLPRLSSRLLAQHHSPATTYLTLPIRRYEPE